MKIEHYHFTWRDKVAWRWRIVDDLGIIMVQGMSNHKTHVDSQYELNEVLDFLEAWSRERTQHGGV
jgi:hypothetical protein